MKPRPMSMPALAFASLLAVASGCGRGSALPSPTGSGGSTRTVDAGTGGTAGTSDAGVGARDLAADAELDSSKVAPDASEGGFDGAPDSGAPDSGAPDSEAPDSGAPDSGAPDSEAPDSEAPDSGAPDSEAPDASAGREGGFTTVDGVLCPRPTQALITDFTYVAGDGGTTTAVPFGNGAGFSGTEYVYPTTSTSWPVTSDVTGNNWHITGLIGDYSGFGLSFDGCSRLDASAFHGLSFTISGVVSQGSVVTMGVSTLNNTIAASWLNTHGSSGSAGPGRCIPNFGTNQYTQSSCAEATAAIPVSSIPTVQTILWSDLTGGKPEAIVTPSDILAIYWTLPTPTGAGTATAVPYALDITIDNLAFVP